MFPVQITLTNAAQLTAVMQALAVSSPEAGAAYEEVSAGKTVEPTTAEMVKDLQEKVAAAPAPKPPKAKPTPAPTPETPAPTPTTAEAVPPPADVPASKVAPSTNYPTLQKAVFKLAGIDAPATRALAATFGVKTFRDLPADKWGDALDAVTAKFGELTGATA